jgi:ribosomal protein S18 acetylase RimI-like enzyme
MAAGAKRASDQQTVAEADPVRVRPGGPGDIAAVMAIDTEITGLAKADYWHGLFDARGRLRGGQRFFIVAEESGAGSDRRVVGFIIGEARAWEFGSPPCGYVFALSVDPRIRQGGIGSLLFEAISAKFRLTGVDRIRTMLSRDNHLLMSFFRSHGMMAGPYIQLEKELD